MSSFQIQLCKKLFSPKFCQIGGAKTKISWNNNNCWNWKCISSQKMATIKATWNGTVIAEAPEAKIVIVEKNSYFPPDTVKMEFVAKNSETYTCPWKGNCVYFDVTVNGKKNPSAAWMYPEPKDAAKNIKGHYAFWKGITIG